MITTISAILSPPSFGETTLALFVGIQARRGNIDGLLWMRSDIVEYWAVKVGSTSLAIHRNFGILLSSSTFSTMEAIPELISGHPDIKVYAIAAHSGNHREDCTFLITISAYHNSGRSVFSLLIFRRLFVLFLVLIGFRIRVVFEWGHLKKGIEGGHIEKKGIIRHGEVCWLCDGYRYENGIKE